MTSRSGSCRNELEVIPLSDIRELRRRAEQVLNQAQELRDRL